MNHCDSRPIGRILELEQMSRKLVKFHHSHAFLEPVQCLIPKDDQSNILKHGSFMYSHEVNTRQKKCYSTEGLH